MSIPERIWRIIRGRWLMADPRVQEALAEELAARELAESAASPSSGATALPPGVIHRPAATVSHPTAAPGTVVDPLAADLALLGAPPACDMEMLDRIYRERLMELRQEELPGSTADRGVVAARRTALGQAYERLRDAINTTETRFEKLEL